MTLPTVVVVPGAWSNPPHYQKLRNALEARSFEVHIPALPTNNGQKPPTSSYEQDVALVHALVEGLVDQGKEVVLVMHSYGGSVGTDALDGLARKTRREKGLPGGVVHLLYLCAYMLAKGQSVLGIVKMSGLLEEIIPQVTVEDNGTWLPKDAIWAMYHDLEPEDQEEQSRLNVCHNKTACWGETRYEAWRDIATTYFYTSEDRCAPPLFQDICLENAKAAGVEVEVVSHACGHSPYVKIPDTVADLVLTICQRPR